jgi:hypothetical protein
MHDRLRLALEHRRAHRARVEQVNHHRLRAQRPQQLCTRRRGVGTDRIVASVDQLGKRASCQARRSLRRREHASYFSIGLVVRAVCVARDNVVLARASARFAGNDAAVVEDLATPDAPRFLASDRAGKARRTRRAAGAESLRLL